MQKFIIPILITLLTPGCINMEIAKDAEQPIEFVLEAPDQSKDQLFSASKSWIAETFVSGKAVIDDADKDSGRIIAKGRIEKPCAGIQCAMGYGGRLISFTLRIDTKNGKIRTTYTNPTIIIPPTNSSLFGTTYISGSPETERALFRGDVDVVKQAFKTLSDDLQHYVVKETAAKKDW